MRFTKRSAVIAALAVVVSVIIPMSPASSAPPVVNTTLGVEKTGSEPFDGTTWDTAAATGAGTDADEDNNVVRLQDTITYRLEASVNDAPADNLVSEVLLDAKQAWIAIPTGCQTDVSLYPLLSPVSAIVDSTTGAPGGDARLLICNFGTAIEGANRVAYPTARAIGASFDGTQITLNDDRVSASVETYADTDSNTATAGPTETIVTADFRVNLTKELLVTALDPDTGEPLYKAPFAAGPSGENGSLMEYVIRGTYQNGSMIADSDEITFEQDYDLFDYFSDNNINNDGALSSGGVLYSWDPAKPGCSLAGDHGPNASVTCGPGPVGDFTSSTFAPDGSLNDPTISIDLDNIDVRDPDSDGHLFEINVLIWFDRSTEIQTHQSCNPCENVVVNSAGVFDESTGTSVGFNPISTEDAGGNNLLNYGGAGEPHPEDTQVSYVLIYSGPGSHSAYKSFYAMPWSATPKSNEQTAAAGSLIPVMQNVFDYRLIDGAVTQLCDKIDTSVFEFAGFAPGGLRDRGYGFNHGDNNPNAVLFTGSQGTQYYDGAPFSSYLYSTEPHDTLAELRDDTCDDDVDGDGIVNIMGADGVESNPGSPVDWYEDSAMVPGGMETITKVRWESYYDQAANQALYIDHAQYAITTNYLFRVKLITEGYGPNDYLPNFMTSRYNDGEGTPFTDWTVETAASIDPNDAAFSYSVRGADRMVLVPSSHSIGKVTEPAGLKVVRGGDDVDFILTPAIHGLWNDVTDNTARVRDILPAGTDYVFGSERFSVDGGTTWLTYTEYQASSPAIPIANLSGTGHPAGTTTLRWNFTSVENGEQLPMIKYTVHVADALTNGSFTNTAWIDSPMGIDVSGNGSPDSIRADYSLAIRPQLGIDVLKVVSDPIYEVNAPFSFDLIYKNLGGESYSSGDFIDILPWNGDGSGTTGGLSSARDPGSDFTGTFELTNMVGAGGEVFYATDAPSASLETDPCVSANQPAGYVPVPGDACHEAYVINGNLLPDDVAAGTGIVTWVECTSTTAPVTCGSLDPSAITAIRFVTGPIPASAGGRTVTIELTPSGNTGGTPALDADGQVTAASTGDVYTNNFGGRVPENSLQIISNDVSVTVVSGSIGNFVWTDTNSDGVQDPDERPMAGIDVLLLVEDPANPGTYVPYQVADPDNPGSFIDAVATTDADGMYLFENLPSGNYQVQIDTSTLPDGLTQTFDADGAGDDSSNISLFGPNNPDTASGLTSADYLDVDDNDEQDFGYVGPGSIGDTVWLDTDGDGVQDPGEAGIAGVAVTVTYLGPDGVPGGGDDVVYTAVTDADGMYLVDSLPLGEFTVEIDPTTLPASVAQTFDSDGVLDNASSTTLTETAPVDLDQDFGYEERPGLIGDTVWIDTNGDGVQDPGEAGIPGVTVTVTDLGPDGVLGGGDDVVYTAVTDADGMYLVEDLPFGDYVVTVDTSTLPEGLEQTFDADGGNDHTSATTLSAAAPSDLDQDFGYREPLGSIGDTVWIDTDGDGVQGPDEPGIPGVTVVVTNLGPDGVLGGGDDTEFTAVTDADGNYTIGDLPYGDYAVSVDTSTLPAGSEPTFDADGGNDHRSEIIIDAVQPDPTDQDFGYISSAVVLENAGDDPLASTGSSSLLLGIVGMLLLAAGSSALVARRRWVMPVA